MLRVIARNIASNWIGYAVNAVVIFFLTPFVLHSLGDTRYGVWILANGLTGYFGLLDLGLRGGTIQYLTRYLTQGDFASLNRTASTSIAGLAVCGFLVVVASVLLSWLSPSIFTVSAENSGEVRWCILIIGMSTAFGFAFAPYSAVFAATQRYDLANIIEVSLGLVTASGTVAVLTLGYGLLGVCIVKAVGDILGCLLRARVAHLILTPLQVSLRLVAWSDFRPILSYGIFNSLIQGATILKTYSSSLIIGIFMPLAAIASFNLAAGMVLQIEKLFAPVAMVFFPVTTQLDVEGDFAGLRRIYCAMSRVMLCIAVTVALIGAIWAEDFYRLWIGPEFVDGRKGDSVVMLFWVLIAAGTISTGQRIGIQILMGCRAMRTLAMLTLIEAAASLVLILLFVQPFGLFGVVVATLIPVTLVRGLLFPIAVCSVLHTNSLGFFRAVYPRPCLLGLSVTGPLLFLHRALPVQGSWATLVLCGAIAGLIAIPFLLLLAIDAEERTRLFTGPLRRSYRRLRRDKLMNGHL